MFFQPLAEGHHFVLCGNGYGVAFESAAHGVEGIVFTGVPNGVGFAVEKDEDFVEGVAGGAEADFLVVDFATVHDSQVDEGSVGDRHVRVAKGVVDDFVLVHDGARVGAGFAVNDDTDDDLVGFFGVLRPARVVLGNEDRFFDGGDEVRAGAVVEAFRVDGGIGHVEPFFFEGACVFPGP